MAPSYHVASAPPSVIGSASDPDDGLVLHVAQFNNAEDARLSGGSICDLLCSTVPTRFELSDWVLTIIEH